MRLRHAALLPALLAFLFGCVSMEAVKDYSVYSRATMESVNPVARDFYRSCLRANAYKPLALRSECNFEGDASEAIMTVAAVLDAYGAALGALASDELVDYRADTGRLTDEAKKLKTFDDKQVDAVGKLASLIGNAATSAYRQEEVVKLIRAANDSVIIVSNALADLVESNYSHAIALEVSAWEEGYRRLEATERDSKPLDWETYSKAQWETRSDLQAKLSAARALAGNIRAIGETHEKLKRDADRITGKEAYASVRAFIDASKPVIEEVQEAFSKK